MACTFFSALSYEDNSTAFETLRITPKKKVLKITIDREQVVVKKVKGETPAQGKSAECQAGFGLTEASCSGGLSDNRCA